MLFVCNFYCVVQYASNFMWHCAVIKACYRNAQRSIDLGIAGAVFSPGFFKGILGLRNQNFLGYVIHYYVIMMS